MGLKAGQPGLHWKTCLKTKRKQLQHQNYQTPFNKLLIVFQLRKKKAFSKPEYSIINALRKLLYKLGY